MMKRKCKTTRYTGVCISLEYGGGILLDFVKAGEGRLIQRVTELVEAVEDRKFFGNGGEKEVEMWRK